MTWTKLGDEYLPETFGLSDAAFRTHTTALLYSSWRLLDLVIPKSVVRLFAGTRDPDAAVAELLAAGWWQDCGDTWYVGCRFAEWQQDRVVVERKRELSAATTRRNRRHKAGDHSLCDPDRCDGGRDASQGASRDASVTRHPGRDGTVTGQGPKDATEEKEHPASANGQLPSPTALHTCDRPECDSTDVQLTRSGARLCRPHAGTAWIEHPA